MWELVRQNQIKTVILMTILAFLMAGLGYGIAAVKMGNGPLGMGVALLIWGLHFTCSYYLGDSLFLSTNRAKKMPDASYAPTLWNVTEEMAIASGMAEIPNIYIIDERSPNAFAVGRDPDHSSVAVTSGLLELCNRDELQGVIAHELAHINNRDSFYMMMAASMISIISSATHVITSSGRRRSYSRTFSRSHNDSGNLLLLLLPALIISGLSTLVYYGISRKREYLADATGAIYSRYPEGLASALEKIHQNHQPITAADKASAPLYIVNPLKANLSGLFSTHPSVESRVQILRSMGGSADYSAYNQAYQNILHTETSLIPKSALNSSTPVQAKAPPEKNNTFLNRHRETTDTLWKLNDYRFVSCDCNTSLKIPAAYLGQKIACPHCHKSYTIE